DLITEAQLSRARKHEEQLLVDVMDVEREGALAGRHHRQRAAEVLGADFRSDAGKLCLKHIAVRVVAKLRLVEIENRLHPTDPSSETPISFCVSAMNSMGSFCSTSRTKPLTTSATASSCDSPRWRQ